MRRIEPLLSLGYLTVNTDPMATIEAAAEAGYGAVGIRVTGRRVSETYPQVLGDARAIGEMAKRLADTGMRLSSVSAYHIYDDVTPDHLQQVLDASAGLGAETVVSNSYLDDESQFLDIFGRYCELAAQRGIRLAIEPMRYSGVKSLKAAVRLIAQSGQANAGLLLDPLHLERSGETPEDVVGVDPGRIFLAQLCDAAPNPRASEDDLRHEARTGRLYPGEGSLLLRDFLSALPNGIAIEIETPRPDESHLPPARRARNALAATQDFLDRFGEESGNQPVPVA